MSLLVLLDELLVEVIGHVYQRQTRLPNTFAPNCASPGYRDLRNLSLTCVRLRQLCGPEIFRFMSLVRRLVIDVLLARLARSEKFSDARRYQGEVKNMLQQGFVNCVTAEKKSFRSTVNKKRSRSTVNKESVCSTVNDAPHVSRYHRIAFCNYVTLLEIDNPFLKYGQLHLFPHLLLLKVLDLRDIDRPPIWQLSKEEPFSKKLASLLVSFKTLLRSPKLLLVLPSVQRLDTIVDVDFYQGQIEFDARILHGSLRELNLILTDAENVRSVGFLDLLTDFFGPSLESISFRLGKEPVEEQDMHWYRVREAFAGPAFVAALQQCPTLKHISIDSYILSKLRFPRHWVVPTRNYRREILAGPILFTYIDHDYYLFMKMPQPEEFANIVNALAVTEIVYVHTHLTTVMDWMPRLLGYLALASHRTVRYNAVNKLSVEGAWLKKGDDLERRYFQRLSRKYDGAPSGTLQRAKLHHEICTIDPSKRVPDSPPGYRIRKHYKVQYQALGEDPLLVPTEELQEDRFWSVECSLRDMVHYYRWGVSPLFHRYLA